MSETDFREQARKDAEREIDDDAMRKADGLTVDEDVKESYRESTERGANQKGEGRLP